jgi:hypothetical protein
MTSWKKAVALIAGVTVVVEVLTGRRGAVVLDRLILTQIDAPAQRL